MTSLLAAILLATVWLSPPQTRPSTVTSLWRDDPEDPARVRIDLIPDMTEASDLLLRGGALYTISDSYRQIYQIDFGGPGGSVRRAAAWTPSGLPAQTDLEALAQLPGGEVLLANETDGVVFVLSPFPRHACAAWPSPKCTKDIANNASDMDAAIRPPPPRNTTAAPVSTRNPIAMESSAV